MMAKGENVGSMSESSESPRPGGNLERAELSLGVKE